MRMKEAPIRLRVDVDYPYPSRMRSFIFTAAGLRIGRDYLKNSKIVAKMVNASERNVEAYWFFTPKTMPDKELLTLLDNDKHEVGLHVVNEPERELELLEKTTGEKVQYYTVHGTERFLGRIIWRRGKTKKLIVPPDFSPQSFYQFTASSLDVICHFYSSEQAVRMAEQLIHKGHVLHFHPIWLFQKGRINHRGPFYEVLRRILRVDTELEALATRKKAFFKMASDTREYARDIMPTEELLCKLKERGVDIFSFIERTWCFKQPSISKSWGKSDDNVALLRLGSYDEWLKNIGKKTRNMIRKAEKSGIETRVAEPDDRLAEGIWRIYNEAPVRQGRAFPHYGASLKDVEKTVFSAKNSTYVAAYLQDELVGFIQLDHGNNVTIISQILSLQKHWDKAVNNALVAKAIETCADRAEQWVMYGRMGNHPTLDSFKQNNGFGPQQISRYYAPLTAKGKIAVKLGLCREIKDMLPRNVKYALIPLYNWLSRIRIRRKLSTATRTST